MWWKVMSWTWNHIDLFWHWLTKSTQELSGNKQWQGQETHVNHWLMYCQSLESLQWFQVNSPQMSAWAALRGSWGRICRPPSFQSYPLTCPPPQLWKVNMCLPWISTVMFLRGHDEESQMVGMHHVLLQNTPPPFHEDNIKIKLERTFVK